MTKRAVKPSFDWRESGRELAIVVLGVLIALLAQQLAQDWEWRQKVHAAEAAMQRELFYDDGPLVYQRAATHHCLQQRLDAVRTAVHSDKSREEVSHLIDGIQLEFYSFDSLAIESAFASDVAAHMPQDRLNAYIQSYQMMPVMDRTNALESAALARLRSLPRTGGTLSGEERSRVLEAVEALRNYDELMYTSARWTLPTMRKLGGKFDPVRVQRNMNFARHYYGACVRDLPPDWAPQSPFHPDNYRPGQPLVDD